MSEWRTFLIQEAGKVITGKTPPKSKPSYFSDTGLPFLTPSDMDFNLRHPLTERFISTSGAESMASRILPPNSTCVVCIGSTIGKASLTDQLTLTNQQLNSIIPDIKCFDPKFIYYTLVLLGKGFKRIAGGSTAPILNKTDFSQLEFLAPCLDEQRAISETLSALDDKIESNQVQVELIPELIHNLVEQDLNTYGSRSVPVSQIGQFINGGAYTKEASGKGRMVIRIADLNSGPGPSTVYNDISVPEYKVALPGDILMSWSGSLGVYVWYRPEAIVNQHIFKVIPNRIPHWLVFDRLNVVIDAFRGIAADKATTMGHIRRSHLNTITVRLPQCGFERLETICTPLWERRNVLLQELLRLAELRDTLLPELMSGRIRVPEAREAIKQETPDD